MTCEEYRKVFATEESFIKATGSERLAGGKHQLSCRSCQTWFKELLESQEPTMAPEEAFAVAVALKLSDLFDPENQF